MNYRNKALRDSAADEPCVVCGMTGVTVWAHSNQSSHGKGTGIKAHDLLGLYLCSNCHRSYDMTMTREEARDFFRIYYPMTMVRLAEKLVRGDFKL